MRVILTTLLLTFAISCFGQYKTPVVNLYGTTFTEHIVTISPNTAKRFSKEVYLREIVSIGEGWYEVVQVHRRWVENEAGSEVCIIEYARDNQTKEFSPIKYGTEDWNRLNKPLISIESGGMFLLCKILKRTESPSTQ